MSEVISSLQFHDITRQQIEHVIDVFDELGSEGLRDTGRDNDVANVLGDTGRPPDRSARPCEKRDAFRRGEDDGWPSRDSGQPIGNAERNGKPLIGVAGKEDSSFLSDLNHSVSFVIGSLSRNAETDTELAGAVNHVSGLIQNVSAFVNDIEEIASEIELIAINAQIRAARTTGNGGALGVLAEAIRRSFR